MTDKLSASEALWGFVGWLTSLEAPVTFSNKHDAAIASELVSEFIRENGFDAPRTNWFKELKRPTTRIIRKGKGIQFEEKSIPDDTDFKGKVESPFQTLDLFGAAGVKVHFVGAAGETKTSEELRQDGISMICPRLQVPHIHKMNEQGVFVCTLPLTLEEEGL